MEGFTRTLRFLSVGLALVIVLGCCVYAHSPVAVCANKTVYLNAGGTATIVAADVDGGSYNSDSDPYTLSIDVSAFDCGDLGTVPVTLMIAEDPPQTGSDTCVATVTVIDNIAPVISGCPGNISVTNDAGLCGAVVTWTSATATDNCGLASFGPDYASGSLFPVGTTTVTYTATDTSGNKTTCSFTVTVTDTEKPVITGCPSNITQGTDAGQCRARVYWTAPTAADNCGVATFTSNRASGSWFNKGTATVTYTATDIYGNKQTCSFTVTVNDDDAPVISGCPSDITQNTDSGKCDAVVTWTAPTATDNCTTVTLVPDIAPGSTFAKGTTAVMYTATDTSGNAATCSFNVTVVDNEAPKLAGCPGNITQNTDSGKCDAVVTWTAPTASDNCPGVVLISTHAPGDVFLKGTTTVTYTATDGAGNTASCSFTVTVNDTENPVISGGPGNITQGTDPGVCTAVVTWTAPVASDNCGVASFSPDIASGSTFVKGATLVTYTATDTSGNTATYSFTVTVQDTEAPVITGCPSDITVNTRPGLCDAIVTWTTPTRTDNCGVTSFTRTGPASGSTFSKGTTTITYTAKDAANNVATCSFNVIVVDNELPTIAGCPGNITQNTDSGKCNAVVTWTAPTASDNCGIASWTPSHNPGATFAKGTTTVTYTAVDTSGNTATCTFTVTIVDNELPVISGCPANITKNTDPGLCTAVATWTAPSASDNCGGLAAWGPNYPSGYAFPVGVTTVTYTAVDTSGNTATCSFTVTVNEAQAPTAVCKSATVYVNSLGQASVTGAQVDGGSTDNCGVASLSVAPSSFTCANLGANSVVLTVTDYAGNSATCNATVTVLDTVPPVINGLPGNITQVNDAGKCGANVTWAAPSATDNCSIASFNSTNAPGSYFAVGVTTVTYTAIDGSGNSSTGSFTVTVTDAEVPTISCPSNVLVGTDAGACSASGVALGSPTTSDNCAVASTTNNAPSTFPLGDTFVTWTATDGAGNAATCQQKVTVVDDDAPTAVCKAATVALDASGSATLTPDMVDGGSSDSCGSVTLSIDKSSFTCANLGANTVVLTVTDGAGNVSTCNATVTVVDALAPTISGCPTDITVSSGTGSCSGTASWTAPSASDNCGLASFVGSHAPGALFPVGTTVVTYTATDTSGNVATCSFNVTVVETIPPTISGCPSNITQNTDPGLCSAVVTWAMPTGSDNCAIASVTCVPSSGSTFAKGTTTVTCTATDTSGNTATCSFTVTVVDAEAPAITGCPANIVQNNDVGLCSAVVSWVAPVATDNCPGVVMTSTHAPGAVFPSGVTTVTYMATDAVGLTATCSFTVTVVDAEAPVITGCPGNIIQGTDAGLCSAVVTWTLPLASDNCGIATFVCSHGPGMTFPKGVTVVNCLATDTSGNTAACSFTITVVDDDAPVISGLADLDIVLPAGARSASGVNLGTPTVIDNCDPAPAVGNDAPGSFSMGRTVVTWTATDAGGNVGTYQQNVFASGTLVHVIPLCQFGDENPRDEFVNGVRTFLSMMPPAPALTWHGAPIAASIPLGDFLRGCFRLEGIDAASLGEDRPVIQVWRTEFSAEGLQSTHFVGDVPVYTATCATNGVLAFLATRPASGFEAGSCCCAVPQAGPFFVFQIAAATGADGLSFDAGYYDLNVRVELEGGVFTSPRIRVQIVAPRR